MLVSDKDFENFKEMANTPVLTKAREIKDLLSIYKMNCFSLSCSPDDTEVEEEITYGLQKIEERIIELAEGGIINA